MPRIMIRTSDRRILFFSHADLRDLHPHFEVFRAKYPDDTTIYSPFTLPPNLRLGGYLDVARQVTSHRPHGHLRRVLDRRAEIDGLIETHLESIRNGALLSVPTDGARRYIKFLRMVVQASLRDAVLRDITSWTLLKAGTTHGAWDFVDLTDNEDALFRSCFKDAGAYALGWFNAETRTQSLKTVTGTPMPIIVPSQAAFDLREASLVPLIPSSEIDRTDATLRNAAHPWTARDTIVAKINERLPWYQPSVDALLASSPHSVSITGMAAFSASQGYYTGSTVKTFIAFRPVLSSSKATLTATVHGVPVANPFIFNASLEIGSNSIALTVTAQDQETTMTYIYDINRT